MRRKSGDKNGATIVRDAYPRHILFDKVDGLYYLRGKDLVQVRKALGLECESSTSVGFDSISLSVFLRQLLSKGLQVGILEGRTLHAVRLRNTSRSCKVDSTTVGLAPKLLLDQTELDRLQHRFGNGHTTFKDRVQELKEQISKAPGMTLKDFGTIYVYQIDEGTYEVDWELTTMTPDAFEVVAFAAHLSGQMLPCRLVLPKPKRSKKQNRPRLLLSVCEPVTFGQLRMAI